MHSRPISSKPVIISIPLHRMCVLRSPYIASHSLCFLLFRTSRHLLHFTRSRAYSVLMGSECLFSLCARFSQCILLSIVPGDQQASEQQVNHLTRALALVQSQLDQSRVEYEAAMRDLQAARSVSLRMEDTKAEYAKQGERATVPFSLMRCTVPTWR